jgi:hypothetical protein
MAASFNGVDQGIDIGRNLSDFQNIAIGTMMCWVYLKSPHTGTSPTLMGLTPGGANPGFDDRATIYLSVATNWGLAGRALDGGVLDFEDTGVLPPLYQWIHVAAVFRYVANSWSLYVNGVSVFQASAALGGVNTSDTPSNQGALMAEQDVTNNYVNGLMDDARLYNREVSPNELLTIVAARGADGIYAGMTSRWMLNELAPGNAVVAAVNSAEGQRRIGVPAGTPLYTDSTLRGPRTKTGHSIGT